MRKISRKILGYLLSVAMVMSSLSLPAFATEIDDDIVAIENEAEAEIASEVIDEDAEEVIVEDADEEAAEEIIPEDVEDEEFAEENVESVDEDAFFTFSLNGEALTNFAEDGFSVDEYVDGTGLITTFNQDLYFVVNATIPENYLIDKFYYTVGSSTEEKNLKGTSLLNGAYVIPAADNKGENISVVMTTREFVGKVTFSMNGEDSDALEFADGTVFDGWNLCENGSDIKVKLTADLTGKVVKSFTYQPAGAEEPIAFGAPDADEFYTIPADANTGVDIAIELVTEDAPEPICGITFTVDGEADTENLIFIGDNVDDSWKVYSAEDIIFELSEDVFKDRYGVDTITYQVGSGEVVDLEDVDGVYTIPATALTGEDIVIALTTKIVNPICTKYELSGVGKDNVITLPVGTKKAFEVVKEPDESLDDVVPVLSDDANGFNVGWDWDGFCVVIFDVPAEEVKGSFSFVNRSVEDEKGEYPVLSTYTIKGKNPEWTGKKVSASVTSTTDVAINVNIKPFASISEDLSNGKYFYKVELVGTPDLSNTELELNSDLVEYYIAGEDELNISIVPFWKETELGLVPANLGEGIAANFKVEVTLVQRKNSVDIPESDEDVFLSSQKLVLSTATKAPHYAEKISIKKGQTTLYAGEGYYTPEVKIGTVTFGKNDTFVTNQNWTIRTLIAPNGESLGSVSKPYSEKGDSLYGVKLYNSTAWNDYEDNGIYASITTYAMPGKYTAIIVTNDENGQTPEAKITFTVNSSVYILFLTTPNTIYKNGNKKVAAKTSVISLTKCFNKDYGYTEEEILKNPKVSYKVGIYNSMSEDIDAVEGITIDKKGVITIDKKFKVTDENKDTVYSVMVSANDFEGNPTDPVIEEFKIVNEAVKVKTLEAYIDNGEEATGDRYTKITSKTKVPYDVFMDDVCFAVKGTDGKYILGGNGKDGNANPVCEDLYFGSFNKDGLMLEANVEDIKLITKPQKVTITVKSLDGSKAKVTINIGYSKYGNKYDDLAISRYSAFSSMNSGEFISEVGEKPYEYEIPSEWGEYPTLLLTLADGSNPENIHELFDSSAIGNPVSSGSISVKGAKVLIDYATYIQEEYKYHNYDISCPKNQMIIIKPTKPTVKITVTKPMYKEDGTLETVKKQYVIKCSKTDESKPKAPKIKSAVLGVPTEKDGEYSYEKLSIGRNYNNGEVIEFKLAEALKLPEGVNAEDVCVSLDTTLTLTEAGLKYKVPLSLDGNGSGFDLMYCVDADGKNPCVRLKCFSGLEEYLTQSKLNITLNYYYYKDLTPESTNDDEFEKVFLTKNASSCVAKFTKYTKSFKANASQTLKFSAASGDTPATVTADFIKGKGKNVKSVELLKVCNCNVKGKYNDFDQFFEVKDGKLSVVESKLEVLNAEALKAKKKVPASKTGYVYYLVTYTDGSTQEILSKVTVKFTK